MKLDEADYIFVLFVYASKTYQVEIYVNNIQEIKYNYIHKIKLHASHHTK